MSPDVPLPRPPFDPDIEASLAAINGGVPTTVTADLIGSLRISTTPDPRVMTTLIGTKAICSEERTVPGATGRPDLTVVIIRPEVSLPNSPALFWIHGGGMVMGSAYSGADLLVDWVDQLGVVAVSIDYRLAPEHPDPAPVEDCYAGLVWTVDHAHELGIDASQIIIGGRSAGGGLAAGVALLARDRGGPAVAAQLLMCPMLDDRNDSLSGQQFDGLGVWDRTSNDTGWRALLGDRVGTAQVSPYAAPARAESLSDLPPAFIDVGSAETFRDEDVDYALRLWAAGGQAELHVWPGGTHGFDLYVPDADMSIDAKAARTRWLRRTLRVNQQPN
jgi:acetyl esterase/lipase